MRRLGLLIGDSDPLVEYDFQRFLPSHMSFHTGRLDMPPAAVLAATDSLQMMCDSAPHAARKVAEAGVERFLFACTAASFFRGEGWDRQVAQTITDATGVPATTTATAVADALDQLNARRIFLVTPYTPETNEQEIQFLGYRGVAVTGQYTFGCKYSREVSLLPPERIFDDLVKRKSEIAGADALFVSCTMLRSMEIATELEQALSLPVLTSNSAAMWSLLHALGEPTAGVPAGRIFSEGSTS